MLLPDKFFKLNTPLTCWSAATLAPPSVYTHAIPSNVLVKSTRLKTSSDSNCRWFFNDKNDSNTYLISLVNKFTVISASKVSSPLLILDVER